MDRQVWKCCNCDTERVWGFGSPGAVRNDKFLLKCQGICGAHTPHSYVRNSEKWVGPPSPLQSRGYDSSSEEYKLKHRNWMK